MPFSTDFVRTVNSTLTRYLRGEQDNTMRNRVVTGLITKKDRVVYNVSGRNIEERVKYRQHTVTGYGEMSLRSTARFDGHKIRVTEWRGLDSTDLVHDWEVATNKGEQAILKIVSTRAESLNNDMKEKFGTYLFTDGNASGNELTPHGFESLLGVGGSETVADGYESPSDTYDSLVTALANYSGSWTGSWPAGTGNDVDYDFWSPIILDYTTTSGAWDSGATWATNSQEVLRQGIVDGQRSGGQEGMLDLILSDRVMYVEFLNSLSQDQRLTFQANAKGSALQSLGFRNSLVYDGVEVTWDHDVPAGRAYGLNFDKIDLQTPYDQLFTSDEPTWDFDRKATKFGICFMGNWRFNPKFFVHWRNYGT